MTRNRQFPLLAHQPDNGEPRLAHPSETRRRRRRIGFVLLAATLALAGLVATQVALAAPPAPASFTISNSSPTRQTTVNFDAATATDPDGDAVTYAWTFGDGSSGTGQNVSHTYSGSAPGAKTVTLTVSDPNNETTTSSQSLTVVNVPPVANITFAASPEPAGPCGAPGQNAQVPLINQQVGFSSTGSNDPDNANDGNPAELAFAWDLDGNGAFNDAAGAGATRAFNTAGNKTVGLRVTDSDGATNDATASFRVNTIPVASFITDDPTPVKNQVITFASTSQDADFGVPGVNEALTYKWDLDNDGQFDDSTSANPTASFATAGTKTVRLCIRDTGGIARMATKQILIQNTVPNGAFTFSPDSPLPGQPVTFSSTSTPTPGNSLTGFEWDFDWNGDTFTPDASGASVSRSFSSPGPKTVALRVTESGGGFDIVVRTLNVNAGPQASFDVAPSSALVGDPVTLSSTSSDPDGPLVKQEWDLDNDGQFDDANAAVVSAKFARKGDYTLRLRVTDSKGATAIATRPVTIRSRPLKLFSGVVIGIKGQLSGVYTNVTRLLVRAPKGSKISVSCRGKNCPKRVAKLSKGSKKLRFKAVERRFRPGTKLIITVTKSGFLSRQTSFTIRRGRAPLRRDLCLAPGAKKAKRCPSG